MEFLLGFFSGRTTFLRFQVDGPSPGVFGPKHLERLSAFAFGNGRKTNAEGVDFGWIAGDHILDLDFDLAKNVVVDALHFALRVDSQKLPGDLLRAYARVDLRALAADNPSGRPSRRQNREARESARDRLEQEAKDGRFVKRKMYPVLWNGVANELLVGTASATAVDHIVRLFGDTFGSKLTLLAAGQQIYGRHASKGHKQRETVPCPTTFLRGTEPEIAWIRDPSSHNYLGNEFLLWLWFVLDTGGDTITLSDRSQATIMLARSLTLECPRRISGSETIRSEAPAALPEARRAVQSGKLPRRAGLTVVRHDQQMEFSLRAESITIEGAKLPALEAKEEHARRVERVEQLRYLIETADLILEVFARQRVGPEWPKELERMQRWLMCEERSRRAS